MRASGSERGSVGDCISTEMIGESPWVEWTHEGAWGLNLLADSSKWTPVGNGAFLVKGCRMNYPVMRRLREEDVKLQLDLPYQGVGKGSPQKALQRYTKDHVFEHWLPREKQQALHQVD